ncbi:MAG: hypothetical protein ACE5H8_15555 [Alphaproteobacteria bacterium]
MRYAGYGLLLTILLTGCASVDTVKEAQGEGVTKVYAAAYEPVYKAALSAAKTLELEVVEKNPEAGRIVLSHGVTPLSWGERIAVFLTKVDDRSTEVEIVSKPVLEPLNFPPDWPRRLFAEMDRELAGS